MAELQAQGVPRKECNGKAIDTLIQISTPGATRWYHVARTLGWGFLCVIPSDIASQLVEQTLRGWEWALYLEVVKKVHPNTHKSSQILSAWSAADGIVGKPISGKETLFAKADVPLLSTQVEEVAYSEEVCEKGIEDSEDGGDDVEPAPARSLRQLSLIDMFKPRE
ncbi:hypothetical protein PMIN04_010295 [Paraphaeosphaeria minitans]